jgi:hypothetical protein
MEGRERSESRYTDHLLVALGGKTAGVVGIGIYIVRRGHRKGQSPSLSQLRPHTTATLPLHHLNLNLNLNLNLASHIQGTLIAL